MFSSSTTILSNRRKATTRQKKREKKNASVLKARSDQRRSMIEKAEAGLFGRAGRFGPRDFNFYNELFL